ncbi:MAG: UDP-3-O-acyl-N-acetylglucosamine deacetylase [Planctomycetota bacterium]
MLEQETIGQRAGISGVGLHSGETVRVELAPAGPGTGIVFIREDLPGRPTIEAKPANLVVRPRRNALAKDGATVETTEHLLAAVAAAGVQNLEVRLDGPELPGLDGSALPYYEAIRAAGIQKQGVRAHEIRVEEPVVVAHGGASLVAFGRDRGLSVGYTLDYSSFRGNGFRGCALTQFLELEIDEEVFAREIAPARTFVFEEEVEALRAEGLGKGATLENTLVLGKDGIIGNTLRFPDELVRHKILDILGDLALLGARLHGHILATKSGHRLNVELARRILEAARGTPVTGAAGAAGLTKLLGAREIQGLLPHRYPFLLVDRIVALEPGRRAVGLKNVTINEEFFQGHFPGRPVMPGVLIVEAMAQLAGALILEETAGAEAASPRREHGAVGGRVAFLLSLDKVKFRKTVEPGDQLLIEVEVRRRKERVAAVAARASVDGAPAAEAEICFMLIEGDR